MKKAFNAVLKLTSGAALGVAVMSLFGTLCLSWFYQPPIAAKLTSGN